MFKYFILLLAFATTACHSSRKAQQRKQNTQQEVTEVKDTLPVAKIDSVAIPEMPVKSNVYYDSIAQLHLLNFNTFKCKADVHYSDDGGKSYNFNAIIRIQKDSAVWISITSILGEAFRLLVTTDSIKVLKRINENTYLARPISHLQEHTGVPMGLALLQRVLLGGPLLGGIKPEILGSDTLAVLQYRNATLENLLSIDSTNSIVKSILLDHSEAIDRESELTYGDYEIMNNSPFAKERNIIIKTKTKWEISMRYKSIAIDEEVAFPFSVPKNFKIL